MTPVFALFVLQTRSAPAFIEECRKAVDSIKEGQYGYEVDGDDYSQKLVVILKNGQSRFSAVSNGRPYLDVWLTPTSELIVQHEERQYSQTEFPELKKKKKNPLEPLEYGMFDFKMGTEGLIIRANPELVADKVDVTDGVETLYARSVNSDGKTIQLVLSRDEKTKLPTRLKASKEGQKDVFLEFLCKIRPVKDEELTIPASAYAGYKKVDPPKSPSGTL